MARLLGWALVPALLLGLGAMQPVWAQKKTEPARTVQDDAGLFSASAKERANQTIAQIKSQFKKDLLVETLPSLPAEIKGDKALAEWAEGRWKNHNVNGIYVVITKQPSKLQVVVGNETRKLGYFTTADRDELRNRMIARLKEKKMDEALTDGAVFVLDTISKNRANAATGNVPAANAPAARGEPGRAVAPVAQQPAQDAGTPWLKYILIGVVVLIVIWIVMAVIRAMSGGGAPGMAGAGYGGGGGGGFFSSFLAGLFGAAAGMWLYNSFFGHHGASAYGGEPGSAGGGGASEPTDVGGGASSTGGDWGGGADDAGAGGGGGDWGGGGGGDWGGGGGGGDWGGGGGDW